MIPRNGHASDRFQRPADARTHRQFETDAVGVKIALVNLRMDNARIIALLERVAIAVEKIACEDEDRRREGLR
jgi:hypothetical protein